MSTNTDTELLEFFKWWLSEAESDTTTYSVATFGVCYNARNHGLMDDLRYILRANFRDDNYPFGGESVYEEESYGETHHLNPQRIAFVKSQIERLEKLNGAI